MTRKQELIQEHEQTLKELADMKEKLHQREEQMTAMNMAVVIYALLGDPILFPEDFQLIKDTTDELNSLIDTMRNNLRQIDNKVKYEGLLITLMNDDD